MGDVVVSTDVLVQIDKSLESLLSNKHIQYKDITTVNSYAAQAALNVGVMEGRTSYMVSIGKSFISISGGTTEGCCGSMMYTIDCNFSNKNHKRVLSLFLGLRIANRRVYDHRRNMMMVMSEDKSLSGALLGNRGKKLPDGTYMYSVNTLLNNKQTIKMLLGLRKELGNGSK